MSTVPSLTITARAKLNLTLHVVGRRADGYHLLDSLVAFTEVGDELTLRPASEFSFTIDGPMADGLTADDSNLVIRAVRALAKHVARPCGGMAIHLHKVLPVASGIGGGSADAAATLRGLAHLWQLKLEPEELTQLGLRLGADVPVCLWSKTCQMSGVGERLTPVAPLPPVWVVLVNPRVSLSTPDVFRARTGPFTPAYPLNESFADAAALAQALRQRSNDLMAPAMTLQPVIGTVLQALERQTGCLLARMSGSGATCFGLFAGRTAAVVAASMLMRRQPEWWVTATQLV